MDARLVMKMVVAILSLYSSSARDRTNGYKCVDKTLNFEDLFPIATWNPCFKCICENEGKSEICSFVRETCPVLKCSFREMNAKKCCKVCKGCYIGNQYHKDKEIWKDDENNCTLYQCNEGVISNVTPQCQTKCKTENLVQVPGQCCPRCGACGSGQYSASGDCVSSAKTFTVDIAFIGTMTSSLANPNSQEFKTKARQIELIVDNALKSRNMNVLKVVKFTGSLVVTLKLLVSNGSPFASMTSLKGALENAVAEDAVLKRMFVPGHTINATAVSDGCVYDNRVYEEGKNVKTDQCTTCTCQNGSIACMRQTCPQLYCLNPRTRKGKCCPECTIPTDKQPQIVDEKEQSCFIKELKLENGKNHRMDKCTSCECMNGTLFCIQQRCVEDTNCRKKDLVKSESHCCPVCKDEITCEHKGRIYQNRERWFRHGCVVCQCMDGQIKCDHQKCPQNLRCSKGYTSEYRPGSCCLECLPEKKTCISFGDPHYRTFDGKAYSYQGICKYTLVKDCTDAKLFNVITRNDGRYANTFSWIRSVVFKYANLSISLQQNYRVKINGVVVKIPLMYKSLIDIRRIKRYIFVYTYDGITVKWDGESYVAVSLPNKYMNKVCGLCGNFNSDPEDDFTLPNGHQVQSEIMFGDYWIKKGSKSCKRNSHLYNRLRFSSCLGWKFFKAHKVCTKAFSDASILECRSKVSVDEYFQDCVTDVCQCPHGKKHCECGAVRSYYEPCSKYFKSLVWKRKQQCDNSCSGGSVYSTCGSSCRNTCNSLNSVEMCEQQCVAGCHCPDGKVWHGSKCVHPMDCP